MIMLFKEYYDIIIIEYCVYQGIDVPKNHLIARIVLIKDLLIKDLQ